MALWLVLDKTSGGLRRRQAPATDNLTK